MNTGLRAGASGQSQSMIRSKNMCSMPRRWRRELTDNGPFRPGRSVSHTAKSSMRLRSSPATERTFDPRSSRNQVSVRNDRSAAITLLGDRNVEIWVR